MARANSSRLLHRSCFVCMRGGIFFAIAEEEEGRKERGCGMDSRALPRPSRRLELAISLPSCHTLP